MADVGRQSNITGVGVTTRVAMEAADLGILRWDPQRQAIAAMFGDNFEFWRMGGEWQSPSIVMYDTDMNVLGVPSKTGIDTNARRKQLWSYPHNNPDYTTILPCDFIKVGDWWYVAAMVTAGLGNEKRTIFWRSRDLYDWEKTDPYVRLDHLDVTGRPIGHPGNTMLTFDQIGDYVYTFGTHGLARDRGIWLWRMKATEFPYGYFEPWGYDSRGWNWGTANEATPIIQGRFGELCFRYIQGQCVLSFFDSEEYKQTALCVENVTDDWSGANAVDYAFGQNFPQLYGGYISPVSQLNVPGGMQFMVSQWNTAGNDPYWVVRFNATLNAKGAVGSPAPLPGLPPPEETKPVDPTPTPTPAPVDAQDLYALLLTELSASGSTPIMDRNGNKVTLREAVAQLFVATTLPADLVGKPLSPKSPASLVDHVTSARAEGLFNQAILAALADKAGIDIASLYAQVQASFL